MARLKFQFMEEMRILSKLRHSCVTCVMGAVVKDEPLLVMEMMEYGSLYDLLHNETVLVEGELILPILRDIIQGFRFLHASNPQVIHGDLKAQNVLVDSKFRGKVADFGLSQKRQLGATGTPFWMAPELLSGESTNTTDSDVYSFGIVLYEVYSRKEPYAGEDPEVVLPLISDPMVNKRPPVPEACPPKIRSLMTDCLQQDPYSRPTFEEMDLQFKRLNAATIAPSETKARHDRTHKLLNQVFPKHVADALRDGRTVEPEQKDLVTIFFSDIVGFTSLSSTISPIKVSDMLSRLYRRVDALADQHDVFKLETIGDAVIAVTNLSKDQPDHTKRMADFSIDCIKAANETLIDTEHPDKGCVSIRCGFHSGPVVASVVGFRQPKYTILGDSVNLASRMESSGLPDRVHCSERSARLLRDQYPEMNMVHRGKVSIKGKGKVSTFWVNEGSHGTAQVLDSPKKPKRPLLSKTQSKSDKQKSWRALLTASAAPNDASCAMEKAPVEQAGSV